MSVSYTLQNKKVIDGYTFKEVQGNMTGQFMDQSQTVTYIYVENKADIVKPESKSDNTPNYKDKNNNNKSPSSSLQHKLPRTGENEMMAMVNVMLGIIFLALGLLFLISQLKKN